MPVTLPQRLYDQELIDLLAASEKVWIQTHFNHPREITPEAARVCDRLLKAGMPINNHAVLLKGVNDDLAAQRDLCRALLRIKVRPYYLFHCDPVTGAGHFRTSVWKGMEIMEGLRGHMSGLGIPTYVVDSPHGGGKIPLMPNYLVSASDDAVVLRNYEGMLVRYHPTGEPPSVADPVATQGVSGLLAGDAEVLIPEGNPRLGRRQDRAHSARQRRTARQRERQRAWQRPRHTESRGRRIEDRHRLRPRAARTRRATARTTGTRSSTGPRPSRRSPTVLRGWGTTSSCSATAAIPAAGPRRPARLRLQHRRGRGRRPLAARPACRPSWRCSASPTPAPTR